MSRKRTDADHAPGSFYRHALDMIRAAHPTRDPAWQREQARSILTEAFDERLRLLGDEAGDLIGPGFPRTPEEIAYLKEDFDAGAQADSVDWRAASGSTSPENRVEVARVRGIICIRRGEGNNSPAMYLTRPDWYTFARSLGAASKAEQLTDLQPAAPQVLGEGRLTQKQELVDTVEVVSPSWAMSRA
jgi:hypothetical protein